MAYRIYRLAGPEAPPVLLHEVAAGATSLVDTVEPLPWPAWHYRVAAVNGVGEGPASPAVCATPHPWNYAPVAVRRSLGWAVAGSTTCHDRSILEEQAETTRAFVEASLARLT